MEGGSPLQKESECHIGIRLRAATIGHHILHSRYAMDPQLHILNEVRQVFTQSTLLNQFVLTPVHH